MSEFKLKEEVAVTKTNPLTISDYQDTRARTIGYLVLIIVPIVLILGCLFILYSSCLKLNKESTTSEYAIFIVTAVILSILLVFLCESLLVTITHLVRRKSDKKKLKDANMVPTKSDDSSKNKMNQDNKTEGKSVDAPDDKKKEAERLATESAEKKAAADKATAEKDRLKNKIEQAKKDFDSKIVILKKSIPGEIDITPENESYDFSICIKDSGLKFTLITRSLPLYMEWSQDKSKITVLDRKPFILAKHFTFDVEISDPVVDTDPELKSHIKPQNLKIQLVAKYPKQVEKFIEWTKGTADQVRLTNVKQGNPTKFNLVELLSFDASWAELVSSDDASNSLILDGSTNTLTGVVKEPANDIKITTQFECKAMPSLKHSVTLLLTCTMDPEMRWKQIEQSDSDKIPVLTESDSTEIKRMYDGLKDVKPLLGLVDDFSKPNRVSYRLVKAGFDMAYASIRGRSHIKDGKFREDDVTAKLFLDDKAVAIVVSDGAGSASLSRRGSQIVANLGLETLIKSFEKILAQDPDYFLKNTEVEEVKNKVKDIFTAAVLSIRERIEFESDMIRSAKSSFTKKDMYATFLAAVVLPSKDGHILFSYSVGDGAIGVAGASDEVSGLKCVPDHGQSAGQTLFVQNEGATDVSKRLNITIIPGAFSLILMSDGVSDPFIPLDVESKPQTWHSLATQLKSIVDSEIVSDVEKSETYQQRGKLCEWLDSYQPGHHDDRTIATLFYNPISS